MYAVCGTIGTSAQVSFTGSDLLNICCNTYIYWQAGCVGCIVFNYCRAVSSQLIDKLNTDTEMAAVLTDCAAVSCACIGNSLKKHTLKYNA